MWSRVLASNSILLENDILGPTSDVQGFPLLLLLHNQSGDSKMDGVLSFWMINGFVLCSRAPCESHE